MKPRNLLLFAIIFANLILFSLNHITGAVVNRGDYTPFSAAPQISALVWDEVSLYLPGPSRFFRTGAVQTELDVFELRGERNAYPLLHVVFVGLLAKTLRSLELAWMICHAVLPTAIWLILFWRARVFVRSEALAMLIAWFTCLASISPRNLLLLAGDALIQPLELTRTPQPALSFLVVLLAIWALSWALVRPNAVRILIAASAAGALFYSYYFYWLAFFGGLGALGLVLIFTRKWNLLRTVAWVFALGCAAGTPIFIWTIEGTRSGQQHDLMIRLGTFSRYLNVPGAFIAIALLAGLWLYCKLEIGAEPSVDRFFHCGVLAVATGSAMGLNAQLLTGYDAEHWHFYNRALQPLLTYFALVMLGRALSRSQFWARNRFVRVAAVGCAAVLVILGVVRQVSVGRNTAQYHRKSSPEMNVLLWLRSRVGPGSVVGSTDPQLLTMIPGITGTWTFVPQGNRSMASNDEIVTRYLLLSRLEGKSWPEVESELTLDKGFKGEYSTLGFLFFISRGMSPESMKTAKDIWDNMDVARDSRARKLDYLITKRDSNLTLAPELAASELVYQNSNWSVFLVNHPAL